MRDDFDFDAYLTENCAKLTHYCAAVVGNADAEDAAQEAFLRLWQNLHRLPNESAAAVFLYRTAYRLAVDILRSRKRRQTVVPERDELPSAGLSEPVCAALMRLKPVDRAILYSRAVEEDGYADIAARFGKNEAWARKRYSLARKKLEEILGKEKENERSRTEAGV